VQFGRLTSDLGSALVLVQPIRKIDNSKISFKTLPLVNQSRVKDNDPSPGPVATELLLTNSL